MFAWKPSGPPVLEVYSRLLYSHLSALRGWSDKCITVPLIFYAGANAAWLSPSMHHPRRRAPLVTPSLQPHNSISPPKYIHFNMHITGRQHGHKEALPAAVPTWPNG